MKTGAKPLLDKWRKQSAMFKEIAEEAAEEIPPEMIKKSRYYRDLAHHLDSCAEELKTSLE